MYNRRYDKEYIIFDCEAKSFGLWGKAPGGTAALELKDGKGRMTLIIQGLKLPSRDDYYMFYLISRRDNGTMGAGAMVLPLDSTGSCRTKWDFDPENVAGTGLPIEDFQVMAVMLKGKSYSDINVIAPLAGYIGESFDWRDKFYEFKGGGTVAASSRSPGPFVMTKGPAKPIAAKPVSSSGSASLAPKAASPGSAESARPAKSAEPARPAASAPMAAKPASSPAGAFTPKAVPPGPAGPARSAGPASRVPAPAQEEAKAASAAVSEAAVRPAAKGLREFVSFKVPSAPPAGTGPAVAKAADAEARPAAKSIGEILNFRTPDKPAAAVGKGEKPEARPAAKSIGELVRFRQPGELMAASIEEAPAEQEAPAVKEAAAAKEAPAEKETAAVKEAPTVKASAKSIGEFLKVMKKEDLWTPEPEAETASTKQNSDFVTMVKKFREELLKLQEMSVSSAESAEDTARNDNVSMSDMDRLFMENTRMYPFGEEDGTEWIRISRREMGLCPFRNLNLMNNPNVVLACRKYRHLILGRYMDGNETNYLFGVPDFYSLKTAQSFKDAGFGYFRSCGGEAPEEGVNGYWIMEL